MKECSEERYDEMLGILPPAVMLGKGFLVGGSFDHRTCSVTNVAGLANIAGRRIFSTPKSPPER